MKKNVKEIESRKYKKTKMFFLGIILLLWACAVLIVLFRGITSESLEYVVYLSTISLVMIFIAFVVKSILLVTSGSYKEFSLTYKIFTLLFAALPFFLLVIVILARVFHFTPPMC